MIWNLYLEQKFITTVEAASEPEAKSWFRGRSPSDVEAVPTEFCDCVAEFLDAVIQVEQNSKVSIHRPLRFTCQEHGTFEEPRV